MASYHLSIKSGKKGTAAAHSSYIARNGKHTRDEDEQDLVAHMHGNLPDWAQDDPRLFWRTADKHERANGAVYREFELALPAELSLEDQQALVGDFIAEAIGDKAYEAALHMPIAALGDVDQPHVHIMVSDRQADGIERPPEQHFKRYNAAHPERGGCRKDSGGKSRVELKDNVVKMRASWARLQNEALGKAGHSARVDHRSHRERGLVMQPERHLGPAKIKFMSSTEKATYRGEPVAPTSAEQQA